MVNTTSNPTTVKVSYFNPESPAVVKLLSQLNSYWKFSLFVLLKLPTLLFWKIRVKNVDTQRAAITIPFGWRTQNPFKSTYFAAQAGAAELPAGLLASIAIAGQVPISMLPVKVEAEFVKKASSTVTFSCDEGAKFQECVQRALDSGEGEVVKINSTGRLENGEVVSRFVFTWSFKKKRSGK